MVYSFGGPLALLLLSRDATRFNSVIVSNSGLAGLDAHSRVQVADALAYPSKSPVNSLEVFAGSPRPAATT
jgi:pimeloyl-ACP methyl ester carboxylesterase